MKEINPERHASLHSLGLDVEIVKSEGCTHVSRDGVEYLDFVAQCGAVPLGHNPPALLNAVSEFLAAKATNFCTPFFSPDPTRLAKLLFAQVHGGFDRCVFTNSGAETVEAAIKLARAATGRSRILSGTNGFHGKTLGALAATHVREYQAPFFASSPEFLSVPYNDLEALETALSDGTSAAYLVEPVQGEGGMQTPSPDYLRTAHSLCKRYGVLLILDEVQTGLGRTGYLTASEYFDVAPDILLLSKALGGGIVPIGACLTKASVWTSKFAVAHSSTFAGGGLCTHVGAAVIEQLMANDGALLANVRTLGARLEEGLEAIVQRYPSVFSMATGMGLMRALHLAKQAAPHLQPLNHIGAPLISSYLANKHQILTLIALNRKSVLRIEPPLIVEAGDIDRLLSALDDVGDALTGARSQDIFSFVRRAQRQAVSS